MTVCSTPLHRFFKHGAELAGRPFLLLLISASGCSVLRNSEQFYRDHPWPIN